MVSFSVVTAFYKGTRFISKLQTMIHDNVCVLKENKIEASVEFIIVNDSPEIDVLTNCCYPDFAYKVINYEYNKGIHGARATGIKACEGEYVLILDQDDEIEADFLYKQYMLIGNSDIIVSNAWMEQPDGSKKLLYTKNYQIKKITTLREYVLAHNQIASPGQCLIRRKSIPDEWLRFSTKKNGSDDLLLWILMFSRKCNFKVNPSALYTHVYTGENLSNEENEMIESSLEIISYLRDVNYISAVTIKNLQRSREFKLNWNKASGKGKIISVFKYFDIFAPRVIRKVRMLLSTQLKYQN